MTLNELLGSVVNQLQNDQDNINGADPSNPQHGTKLLEKFKAAQAAASSDPSADLGQVFSQVSQAITGSAGTNGFTAKAYGDAFSEGAQAFAGRSNSLSANDLGPIIGMLTNGFAKHDTRGANAAGPLGALAPLLGLLGGNAGGGLDIGKIAGMLMGGGAGNIVGMLGGLLGGGNQQQGGLGGMLGGLLGGGQQQAQNQQESGLGGLLGGLLGGGQQPQQQQAQQGGGLEGMLGGLLGGALGGGQQANNPLGALLGAVTQGAQVTNANGQRDAGAVSTGSVLTGLLGALMKG
ncbi:MAG: hypothetical protein RLZZ156_1540 [Deinococcota bacterium]